MPPMLTFFIRRLLAIPITLFVITASLYGVIMLAPVEARAELYMPKGESNNPHLRPEVMRQQIIEEHGLNDPYPVQYARWALRLLRGDWGWSPGLRGDVLEALIMRTSATAELTIYSVLLLVPLGIASGALAGWGQNRLPDHGFRLIAFIATSIPPFILGLVLLTIFYAGLNWFPPGRVSISENPVVTSSNFKHFTGLLTLDGMLNGRIDISASAFRHLVLPAITLSLAHWATLGRVTRVATIEEIGREYIVAARARGIPRRSIVWIHALRNVMIPALNSTALSAASLLMGVFVVEVIFGLPGVSELITGAMRNVPDTPTAMGFAIYSVLLVLPVMLILDIVQGIVDPRIREGASEA
jgi:ABC-type dipeptide/oligopeptide/nickel transport system permease component